MVTEPTERQNDSCIFPQSKLVGSRWQKIFSLHLLICLYASLTKLSNQNSSHLLNESHTSENKGYSRKLLTCLYLWQFGVIWSLLWNYRALWANNFAFIHSCILST
jgi:hypothetical protein